MTTSSTPESSAGRGTSEPLRVIVANTAIARDAGDGRDQQRVS